MRYVSIRAAAKARRRFATDYDAGRYYTYRAIPERGGWLVGVYNHAGVFLTYV